MNQSKMSKVIIAILLLFLLLILGLALKQNTRIDECEAKDGIYVKGVRHDYCISTVVVKG